MFQPIPSRSHARPIVAVDAAPTTPVVRSRETLSGGASPRVAASAENFRPAVAIAPTDQRASARIANGMPAHSASSRPASQSSNVIHETDFLNEIYDRLHCSRETMKRIVSFNHEAFNRILTPGSHISRTHPALLPFRILAEMARSKAYDAVSSRAPRAFVTINRSPTDAYLLCMRTSIEELHRFSEYISADQYVGMYETRPTEGMFQYRFVSPRTAESRNFINDNFAIDAMFSIQKRDTVLFEIVDFAAKMSLDRQHIFIHPASTAPPTRNPRLMPYTPPPILASVLPWIRSQDPQLSLQVVPTRAPGDSAAPSSAVNTRPTSVTLDNDGSASKANALNDDRPPRTMAIREILNPMEDAAQAVDSPNASHSSSPLAAWKRLPRHDDASQLSTEKKEQPIEMASLRRKRTDDGERRPNKKPAIR